MNVDAAATQHLRGSTAGEPVGAAQDFSWLPSAEGLLGCDADLLSIQGCIQEIENCNRGLAYLDHVFGTVLNKLDESETTWASVEAEAAEAARRDAPSGTTATEIKGGITRWVEQRPSKVEAREDAKRWRRRKEKVDRWMRTLEKRLSAAQSAQNGHDALGRYGGGV